ncbi:MAG: ketopantoate reductase family protein [Egibacteraceae bacterium]
MREGDGRTESPASSILVVGGGAIGGVIAASLAGTVDRVAVLDTRGEHVSRLRAPGLRVDLLGDERTVPLEAYAAPADIPGRFAAALVTVKATDLDAALRPLAGREIADVYVSLGNGLVQERVGGLVGRQRLIVGIVEWGATNLGPGRVKRTTDAPIVLGEPHGGLEPRTEHLAQILAPVAEVILSRNIWGHVWSKLLLNATFSGLGTVAGQLYRDVAVDPAGPQAIRAVWTEGYRVAHAAGVAVEPIVGVPPDALSDDSGSRSIQAALQTIVGRLGSTKASMLQDIERGMATEIDVINGALVGCGRRLGVPTPCNARVVGLVHAMERGRQHPHAGLLQEVVAAR